MLVPSSHNHQNKNHVQLVIIIKIKVRTTRTNPVKCLSFFFFPVNFGSKDCLKYLASCARLHSLLALKQEKIPTTVQAGNKPLSVPASSFPLVTEVSFSSYKAWRQKRSGAVRKDVKGGNWAQVSCRGEPVLVQVRGAKLWCLQKQFVDKCPEELFHFLNSRVGSHVDSKHVF